MRRTSIRRRRPGMNGTRRFGIDRSVQGPQPAGWSQGNAWWKQQGLTPQTKGRRTSGQNIRRGYEPWIPGGGQATPVSGRIAPGTDPRVDTVGIRDIRMGDQPTKEPRPMIDPNTRLQERDADRWDPLAHQRYWAAQGWLYKPGQERFVQRDDALQRYLAGAQGGGGTSPGGVKIGPDGPVGPDGRPPNSALDPFGGPDDGRPIVNGAGGGGQGGGGGGDPLANLPLDPFFEAQRRALEDSFAAQMSAFGPARERIMAEQGLLDARLGTNKGIDEERLREQMAARGIFGSGIQREDEGRLATDYLRQYQDLANATAEQLGGVASGEAEAQGAYQRGLMELLMDLANRSASDPYAVVSERRSGGDAAKRRRQRQRERRQERRT